MFVVATAGHVDHGKSTLVRALTGMQPDRWAEEHRRGLTIDLGFAWTELPSGRRVAFVDVPGHERFIGNMLAGLGPAPVVCFVVAADAGWQAQSGEHRDAVAALDIRHGIVVVTRSDLAPDRVPAVTERARTELADTGLADVPVVAVSAIDGTGLPRLRSVLDRVLAGVPAPDTGGRLRLWVDRSFTIAGAGTVVTGTLTGGTIAVGDRLQLLGARGPVAVSVRGLQSRGRDRSSLVPVDRVALNLRGVRAGDIRRGDTLVSPERWPLTAIVDVRQASGPELTGVPEWITAHAGTAAVPARVRPFDAQHARLLLRRPLPLVLGDRLVLRHPGTSRVLGGVQVLDADPPRLSRRGDAGRRATVLARKGPDGDLAAELSRRRAVRPERLRLLGFRVPDAPPHGTVLVGPLWVDRAAYRSWRARLRAALDAQVRRDPLSPGLSRGAVGNLLELPDDELVDHLAADLGLDSAAGQLYLPGTRCVLGPGESAVAEVERRLTDQPFAAPLPADLARLRLGPRELAAAERAGRLLRLTDTVVLLPTAPAVAVRTLAALPQPFTLSRARTALETTRRVAVPLLELLDDRRWTRRLDPQHREVARLARTRCGDDRG